MCKYAYVHFVIGFFSFFASLGPLGLIIVRHFPKKCGNATMRRSGKNPGYKIFSINVVSYSLTTTCIGSAFYAVKINISQFIYFNNETKVTCKLKQHLCVFVNILIRCLYTSMSKGKQSVHFNLDF